MEESDGGRARDGDGRASDVREVDPFGMASSYRINKGGLVEEHTAVALQSVLADFEAFSRSSSVTLLVRRTTMDIFGGGWEAAGMKRTFPSHVKGLYVIKRALTSCTSRSLVFNSSTSSTIAAFSWYIQNGWSPSCGHQHRPWGRRYPCHCGPLSGPWRGHEESGSVQCGS
jgi:hypothetical protein